MGNEMAKQRALIDTYLLRVLHTLLMECSVKRQPVSSTCRRQRSARRSTGCVTSLPIRCSCAAKAVWSRRSTRCACSSRRAMRYAKSSSSGSSSVISIQRLRSAASGSAAPTISTCSSCRRSSNIFGKPRPMRPLSFTRWPIVRLRTGAGKRHARHRCGDSPEPPEQLHLSNLFVTRSYAWSATPIPMRSAAT